MCTGTWKLSESTGEYEFTSHTTQTAGGGHYLFGEDFDLWPGTYQVREGDVAD